MKLVAGIAAAFLVGASGASAADLGGNCCADLEERVAELEATTARKGNRKVSLTVSGFVNEALFAWDDGVEQNAYIGTNTREQSRVRFLGEAKINADWAAGYTLELGINSSESRSFNQDTDDAVTGLSVRKSNWWLKSKSLGKVTVGREGTATYHLLDDADGANTRGYSDPEAAALALSAFRVRSGGDYVGNLIRWNDVLRGANNSTPGQNGLRDIVRYDSPTFGGFSFNASWGEDDQWGTSVTYRGELGDFALLAKAGYEHTNDEADSRCFTVSGVTPDQDCEWWGVAGTIMHKPTGLYVYGAYSEEQDDARKDFAPTADDTDTMWFVQAGIEKKWLPLGKTTLFGEYRNDDTGSNINAATNGAGTNNLGIGTGVFIQNGDIDSWAGGVIQNIDSAAMDLYVVYHHTEGDFKTSLGDKVSLDDFDIVIAGAKIQF